MTENGRAKSAEAPSCEGRFRTGNTQSLATMNEQQRIDLLRLATAGDVDAVQRLIRDYHRALARHVARGIDVGNRDIDPDDVLQQAYIAAFESIRGCEFDGPAAFYKWLERIATNALIDARRANNRLKRGAGRRLTRGPTGARTSYPDFIARLTANISTPSRHVAKSESKAAVLTSLARLTNDQRTVIRMRFLEGASVAETAKALRKSESAVHMLTHRALKQLKRLLSDGEVNDE